jgi:Zn-dependent protease with chaperone function
MDFFAAQDRARRKTWQLVVLFALAVIGLIVTTNVLVAAVAAYSTTAGVANGFTATLAAQPVRVWAWISCLVVGVIAGASFVKYLSLRSGGRAIVEMLGGRQIDPATTVIAERRLLNVIEEMAIAAGMPVPAAYLIDEPAINAFAAGYSSDDAVIGVTAGTLQHLNRDELQGVIGHEFSHVLNGDSRLNLRLIAILSGIVFLGVIGRMVLRSAPRSRRGSNALPVIAVGAGLIVIGAAGTLCGNLIKAAVSRQREFLADAAAVQFTRNPSGIANALKKIGGAAGGSLLGNARAVEMSHMFFVQAIRTLFGGLMATHPPLPDRIRAIEPGWDGRYLTGAATATELEAAGVAGFAGAAAVATSVGNPTPESLDAARALIGGLPAVVTDAARQASSAAAIVYALLLADDPALRASQRASLGPADVDALDDYYRATRALDDLQRLTLVSLALPALKIQSPQQYATFVTNLLALIRADRRIDLFEWVLHRVLLKALKPHFEGQSHRPVRYRELSPLRDAITEVLSALARSGSRDEAAQRRAVAAGSAAVQLELQLVATEDPNFMRLNDALRQLRDLSPLVKPRVLKGCAACALVDGADPAQRALLIGIGATLDCPLPPDLALENI